MRGAFTTQIAALAGEVANPSEQMVALACMCSSPIIVDARKRSKHERPDLNNSDVRLVQRQQCNLASVAQPCVSMDSFVPPPVRQFSTAGLTVATPAVDMAAGVRWEQLMHAFQCRDPACEQETCAEATQASATIRLRPAPHPNLPPPTLANPTQALRRIAAHAQHCPTSQQAECKLCRLWQALLSRTYERVNPAPPLSYMSSYEQPPPQQAAKVAFIAAAPAAAAATAAIATASAAHQATSTHHHASAMIDNAAYVRSQLGLDEGMTLPQQDSDLHMNQSINRSVHLSISFTLEYLLT